MSTTRCRGLFAFALWMAIHAFVGSGSIALGDEALSHASSDADSVEGDGEVTAKPGRSSSWSFAKGKGGAAGPVGGGKPSEIIKVWEYAEGLGSDSYARREEIEERARKLLLDNPGLAYPFRESAKSDPEANRRAHRLTHPLIGGGVIVRAAEKAEKESFVRQFAGDAKGIERLVGSIDRAPQEQVPSDALRSRLQLLKAKGYRIELTYPFGNNDNFVLRTPEGRLVSVFNFAEPQARTFYPVEQTKGRNYADRSVPLDLPNYWLERNAPGVKGQPEAAVLYQGGHLKLGLSAVPQLLPLFEANVSTYDPRKKTVQFPLHAEP